MATVDTSKHILLVEDEILIGMDIEATLEAADIGDIIHASTCAEAERWLTDNTPLVAILDIQLRDGECDGIARVLSSRGIPFIVHSGTPRSKGGFDEIFLNGYWIAKPFLAEELVSTVRRLLSTDATALESQAHER